MASMNPVGRNRPRMARIRALAPRAALVVGAVLVGNACSGGGAPAVAADDAQLVEGRAVWTGNCIPCHGPTGGGGVGPKLSGGRLLEAVPDPAEQVEIVTNGRRQMPAFNQKLSAEQVQAVVRYSREVIARQ